MNTIREDYKHMKHIKDRKLTEDEIGMIPGFENLSSSEREAQSDFVYNLSKVLYKIYVNKPSELLR